MNTHKLYANQFPYGTIISIGGQKSPPDTGECDIAKESYMVTMCQMMPHNDFALSGRPILADNTFGDEVHIGSKSYLERELSALVHNYASCNLYKDAVGAGLIVPHPGPFIKNKAAWCYQHFPEGTVFVVHKYIRVTGEKDNDLEINRTFTAKSIIHNGIGSYCIETTTTNNEVYGDAIDYGFYTVNITHVEKIIKRGDGVVSVSSAQFNGRRYEKHIYHKSLLDRMSGNDAGGNKTNYTAFSVFGIINQAVAKLNMSTDQELDGDKFSQAFMKQTFVKIKPHRYAKANRKRTDRWIKQNINRFLMPMQLAKDINDYEMRVIQEYDQMDY